MSGRLPGRLPGRRVRRVRTMVVAVGTALALAVPPLATAVPPPAAPADRSVAELLTELQTLYRKAEEASEAYNGTEEKLTRHKAAVKRLSTRLARARARLAAGRNDAGRLAREQYRWGTGLDFTPFMRMLLGDDPQGTVAERHLIGRLAGERAAAVERLTGDERRLDRLAGRARQALDRQQTLAERRKKQRDAVQERLDAVEELLASMSEEQLAAVRRLEEDSVDAAQSGIGASGALSDHRPPSRKGEAALRYALAQVGKPYRWGAQGPHAFDCSGLTSRAWERAGRSIPRTSQGQWQGLPRVSLQQLRPGDLVVYFPGATHVALYAGGGKVVQAPRAGAAVNVSPIASNPLLGAVRPDG